MDLQEDLQEGEMNLKEGEFLYFWNLFI
jgi:hypothetical protein